MIKKKLLSSFTPAAISWATTLGRMPVMYLGPLMGSMFS
jgi:hypothetical protein